jgi:hypothetical protein
MGSKAPTGQVTWGVAIGSAVAITAWGLNEFAGVIVPVEIGVAISTLLTFGVQYYVNKP